MKVFNSRDLDWRRSRRNLVRAFYHSSDFDSKKNSQKQSSATVDDSWECATPAELEEEELSVLANDVKMEYESDQSEH